MYKAYTAVDDFPDPFPNPAVIQSILVDEEDLPSADKNDEKSPLHTLN
jgi:hypothetical protein